MGVEFENLGPREQSALSQIVMRWQREKRRHETQELPARDAPPS